MKSDKILQIDNQNHVQKFTPQICIKEKFLHRITSLFSDNLSNKNKFDKFFRDLYQKWGAIIRLNVISAYDPLFRLSLLNLKYGVILKLLPFGEETLELFWP